MNSPSDIYTSEWYEHYEGIKHELEIAGEAIYRQFKPEIAYDYGCGPGIILGVLQHLGVTIQGYEGSIHGIEYAEPVVRDHIAHADLRTMQVGGGLLLDGSIVICIEVAEHIEASYARHLVRLLCQHQAPIIFTAAPPGQGGLGHVNEQPKSYWLDLFAQHGVIVDYDATIDLKERWQALNQTKFIAENLLVLK